MRIVVNGVEIDLEESVSIAELLERRGLSESPCAVEVNGELAPKRRHGEWRLEPGDRVEIVTLVGGG